MTQFADDAAVGGDPVEDATVATEAVENEQPREDGGEYDMYPDDAPAVEDADAEDGEQQADEDNEPAEPAIEAPASLNAEEKAAFAAASPEVQRTWAAAENRRNAQVTAATTKAANAQRAADERAAMADAQAKAVYSQQLRAIAQTMLPQQPDPNLAYTDPASYVAQKAQYDAARVQYDEFMQHVEGIGSEAENGLDQAFIATRDRELMAIPEIQNEETRDGFFEKAADVARNLGLDMAQVQHATAAEWKALRTIYDDQQDAKKWRERLKAKDAARRNPNGQFKPTRNLPPVTMKPGTLAARNPAGNDPVKLLYPND